MKNIKKITCIVLVIAMLMCSLTTTISATSLKNTDVSEYPTVYLDGAFGSLHIYEDSTDINENPPPGYRTGAMLEKDYFDAMFDISGGFDLDSMVQHLLNLDSNAAADLLIDALNEMMEPTMMDKKGNSVIDNLDRRDDNFQYANDTTLAGEFNDDNSVNFSFDWRRDPIELADQLHVYIEEYLEEFNATIGGNHTKVNICSLSGSCQIAMAYIAKYGADKLYSLTFNVSMQNGSKVFGELAKGNFMLDLENLGQSENLVSSSSGNMYIIFNLLYKTGLASVLQKLISVFGQSFMDRVNEEFIYPCIFRMPGMWPYVPDADYDEAIKNVFKGNTAEYGVLIDKLDAYREISRKQYTTVKKLSEDIKIVVLCSYGLPFLPLFNNSHILSTDGFVETASASFGATCMPRGYTFPFFYKQANTSCGHDDHISPDRTIDASTCLLPENTWFVYDAPHGMIDISDFYKWALSTDDLSVHSDPRFPQFMTRIDDENWLLIPYVAQPDKIDWAAIIEKIIKGEIAKDVLDAINEAIGDDLLNMISGTQKESGNGLPVGNDSKLPTITGIENFISTHEVNFNWNDGSDISSIKVEHGETIPKPEEPTREGYTFGGWYYDSAFLAKCDFTRPLTGGVTIHVKWIEN